MALAGHVVMAVVRGHGLERQAQCLSPVWEHCHGDEGLSTFSDHIHSPAGLNPETGYTCGEKGDLNSGFLMQWATMKRGLGWGISFVICLESWLLSVVVPGTLSSV